MYPEQIIREVSLWADQWKSRGHDVLRARGCLCSMGQLTATKPWKVTLLAPVPDGGIWWAPRRRSQAIEKQGRIPTVRFSREPEPSLWLMFTSQLVIWISFIATKQRHLSNTSHMLHALDGFADHKVHPPTNSSDADICTTEIYSSMKPIPEKMSDSAKTPGRQNYLSEKHLVPLLSCVQYYG